MSPEYVSSESFPNIFKAIFIIRLVKFKLLQILFGSVSDYKIAQKNVMF